jgi:hypothetical protein
MKTLDDYMGELVSPSRGVLLRVLVEARDAEWRAQVDAAANVAFKEGRQHGLSLVEQARRESEIRGLRAALEIISPNISEYDAIEALIAKVEAS